MKWKYPRLLLAAVPLCLCAVSTRAQDPQADLPPPTEAELAAKEASRCRPRDCNPDKIYGAQQEEQRLRAARYAARNRVRAAAECATTFDARAAAAREDYAAWLRETAALRAEQQAFVKAGGPKLLDFFNKHCRFLNKLEIAIRKLDDPNTIVCNAPKPKGLTADIVAFESAQDFIPGLHMREKYINERCQEHDAKERFSLVFDPEVKDAENLIAQQSLLCFKDERPKCKSAMASVAAVKAKLAAKAALSAAETAPPIVAPAAAVVPSSDERAATVSVSESATPPVHPDPASAPTPTKPTEVLPHAERSAAPGHEGQTPVVAVGAGAEVDPRLLESRRSAVLQCLEIDRVAGDLSVKVRVSKRGIPQSLAIAQAMAAPTKVCIREALKRVHYPTAPQDYELAYTFVP
jgi:hypothetical protein